MEWWSEQTGNLIGAFGGAAVGVIGGIHGSMAGMLAPRGKARSLVVGIHIALIVIGVAALITGATAWLIGQPWHVYYPFLLPGLILTMVMGSLYPVVVMRYRQGEQRRMDAKLLRDG
ncbi:MAG: hypothetical protein IT435_19345 [Phycisphaerales bacterium]|nr:hypothetical protein [Phycisphaerales bacterium]